MSDNNYPPTPQPERPTITIGLDDAIMDKLIDVADVQNLSPERLAEAIINREFGAAKIDRPIVCAGEREG